MIQEAFEQHRAALFKTACAIVGDYCTAEDVMQDVYIKIMRVKIIPQYPFAFLLTAVKNNAINKLRAKTRDRLFISDSSAEDVEEIISDGSTLLDEQIIEAELRNLNAKKLRALAAQLAPQQRLIIEAHLNGENHNALARRIGMNKETARTHYKQAMKRLRQLMRVKRVGK